MTWIVGDRIKFAEEKRPYTVQALTPDGRFVICTKPFAARHTVIYTIYDVVLGVRGVDDSIGNSLGYESREDCERAAGLLASGEFGLSGRRRPIPAVLAEPPDAS